MEMGYESISRKSQLSNLLTLFDTVPRLDPDTAGFHVGEVAEFALTVIDHNVITTQNLVDLAFWDFCIDHL